MCYRMDMNNYHQPCITMRKVIAEITYQESVSIEVICNHV